MKKGKEYTGKVERIDFPNKGIVITDDECAIVKNSITGQTVRFVVNKQRKGKSEGRLVEVIEKSPLETRTPDCPHFGDCGGCLYQTLPYDEQLKIKAGQVKKLMDDVIDYEYEFLGIEGSPMKTNYRNKMEFSFGDEYKDGPLALGLHKKGSFYDILNVTGCTIVNNDYNIILKSVSSLVAKHNMKFFHKITHEGYLRHLLVRRAEKTGEILIDIITTTQTPSISEPDYTEERFLTEFKETLLALPLSGKIAGILHTKNDSFADAVRNDGTTILYGNEFIYEELLGLRFKISTFSFFQTNSPGAEVLYSKAREFVGTTKDKIIFDLYSGTGTIAQLLAPVAKKVVGVEIIEEAVEAAKINASLNGLDNCEFIAGDVLKVIDSITEKPDLIVLDPPRDGVNPKALDKIINYGVDRIVYISCKPTSLARDIEIFNERGYRVEKIQCVDMFPETQHVETIALLKRVK